MIETPTLAWQAFGPELITGVGAIVVLLAGLVRGQLGRMLASLLTMLVLLLALGATALLWGTQDLGAFAGQVDADALGHAGRALAFVSALVAALLAWRGRPDDGRDAEFHALLLAAAAGMGMMSVAGSFVTLFVGLELFSIALYVLCALDADRAASLESGLKYLVTGGLASAILLYGVALAYGASGSLDLAVVGSSDERGVLMAAGAAMVLGGLAFKVSAAPLHWWTPDVYEGAPTAVTAFMSVATKAVAFLAAARVLVVSFAPEAGAWVPIVAALAVASIVVGNLGALVQTRVKRMLAWSSVAQAGYLLLGLVGWDGAGIAALTYALVAYAAMTLGAFAWVVYKERELGRDVVFADLAGLGWGRLSRDVGAAHAEAAAAEPAARAPGASADTDAVGTTPIAGVDANGEARHPREPWRDAVPAAAFAICMLSLAGIPLTAGFLGKLVLFSAAAQAGYGWLAAVAAIGSVIGLAYYMRPIVEAYLRRPDPDRVAAELEGAPAPSTGPRLEPLSPSAVPAIAVVVLAALVIALGLVPGRTIDAGCEVADALDTFGVGDDCTPLDAAALAAPDEDLPAAAPGVAPAG